MQKGYATETLLKRLDGLEKEKREISDAIAKEQLKAPIFSQDHFKMALSNFRKIDITTQEGKRKIIDTFINAIYLYDDHLKIIYNANGKEETISLAELESSTLFSRGAPKPRRSLRFCGVLTSVRSEWKIPSIACEEAAQRGAGKAALCSGLSAPPHPFI